MCRRQQHKRRQCQHFVRRPDFIAGCFDKHAWIADRVLTQSLGLNVQELAHQVRFNGHDEVPYFSRDVVLTTVAVQYIYRRPLYVQLVNSHKFSNVPWPPLAQVLPHGFFCDWQLVLHIIF